MYTWKDYGENTSLFIEGMNISVASIRYKDFQIIDFVTGAKMKLKVESIEETKEKAEKMLTEYWIRVQKQTTDIVNIIKK